MTSSAIPDQPDVLLVIERALTRIRSRQGRRELLRTAQDTGGSPVAGMDTSFFSAVEVVEHGPDWDSQEMTVGLVAERLGIDPSRASRVVQAAIKAKYLRRVASQGDGRRICLELTELGQGMMNDVHDARQALYAKQMAGWADDERAQFAELLAKFTNSQDEISSGADA